MGMMMKMNPSVNLTNDEGMNTSMTQLLMTKQLMTRRDALRTLGAGSLALALAGLVAHSGTDNEAAAQAVQQYKTTTALNFRAGPGTSYPVIRVIPAGGIVAHTGMVKNSFYEVGYGDTYGWVHKDYLVPIRGPVGDDQGGNYKTTTASLNLRAEPSTAAKILTVIPAGARVQVLHTQAGQFVNVNYNGLQGWVAAAYLR
jgi:uncharacterized protein YraI